MHRLQLDNITLTNKVKELELKWGRENNPDDTIEWQDVVDSRDHVVGVLPRKVIWDQSLQGYTRVVNIFVKDKNGYILVPVRSQTKSYLPGGYDFSCGENLTTGEDYDSAALRGLEEELGLLNIQLESGFKEKPNLEKGIICFMKVYFVTVPDRNVLKKFNHDEIARLEWMTPSDIVKLIDKAPGKFKEDYKTIFLKYLGKRSLKVG